MTNFEKIATVENLAQLICKYIDLYADKACRAAYVNGDCPNGDEPTIELCIECNHKWLESEADE